MDESDDNLSEITLLPDGRVYVFGMTRPLLEVLARLPSREGTWQAMLQQLPAQSAATESEVLRE